MGVNKVMYGSKTVIDLSGSTIAPDKMLEGIIGYNAAGEEVVGTHQCEKGIGNGAYVWAVHDTKEEWNYTSKSLSGTTFPDGYKSTTYVSWTITEDGYFEVNPGTTSGDTYYLPEGSVNRKAKTILRKGKYSYINPYTVMTIKDAPDTVKGDNLLGYVSADEEDIYPLKGVEEDKYYIRIAGPDADVAASKMLSGVIGYGKNGKVTGSIQSQATQTIIPSATDQTISSGKYLSGAQTIKGDTNLIPENIKKDVSIFGVLGKLESTEGTKVAQGTITGAGSEAVTIDTGLSSVTTFTLYAKTVTGSMSGVLSLYYDENSIRATGLSYSNPLTWPSTSHGDITVYGGKVTYTPKEDTATSNLMTREYDWIAVE